MPDYSMGLLQGVQNLVGQYEKSKESRLDREQRQKQLDAELRLKGLIRTQDPTTGEETYGEDPAYKANKNYEQDVEFYKAGLIPQRGDDGRITGAGVNTEYWKAKTDADPVANALKGLNVKKAEADVAKSKADAEQAAKGTKLPPDKVLLVQEGQQIPTMFKGLAKSMKNLNTGPVTGLIASANPYDTKNQTIDAEIRANAQKFGRYMEGGVLRKEDEEKYRKMFPNLSDTPDLRREKLKIVNKMLVDKHNADIQALKSSGYDIGAFAPLQEQELFDEENPQIDPQIDAYAKEHGLDYSRAESILKARGYGKQ